MGQFVYKKGNNMVLQKEQKFIFRRPGFKSWLQCFARKFPKGNH